MLQIAVCDDEPVMIQEVCGYLQRYRYRYHVDTFLSGKQLLSCGKQYDILFLDIEMSDFDGMEVAKQLQSQNTYIIFLTSHTEYMQEAFKVRAYRYLLKPVQENDLMESLLQAEEEIRSRDKITLTVQDASVVINWQDIVYIEAYGDGSLIYTVHGVQESNKSLKYWCEQLGGDFFYKVHKSYCVAFRYVEGYDKACVFMQHVKQTVPISRRSYSGFQKAFADYIKNYAKYI